MASIGYAVPSFARRRIGARNDENDDDDVANTMVTVPLSLSACFAGPCSPWYEKATARLTRRNVRRRRRDFLFQ
jgi:hypothetical protein